MRPVVRGLVAVCGTAVLACAGAAWGQNAPAGGGAAATGEPSKPPGAVGSAPGAAAGGAAASKPTTRPTTRPSAADVADSLLRPPGAAGRPLEPLKGGPAVDATSGRGAVPPGAPQVTLQREGSIITDRVGRLTRSSDGQTAELTFDSDGKAMQDPPMIILPNLKLMQMENAVTGSSRDLRFRITGTVTEYKGRNYILLEKVVVVPDSQQQF